jgi:hypothetical protein
MTLEEVADGLSANLDHGCLLELDKRRLRDPEDISTICSSLITISKQHMHGVLDFQCRARSRYSLISNINSNNWDRDAQAGSFFCRRILGFASHSTSSCSAIRHFEETLGYIYLTLSEEALIWPNGI